MSEHGQQQAVIYCRVSSTKQTTAGDGLNSQETRCREFARMKGYTVVQVFTDDVSGSLIDRPGMKAMLDFIRRKRGHNVRVLIDDVSRLARGLEAHIELRSAIAKAGGVLESPSIEFGDDPDSTLVENLLATVAQHQRQKNGEQTKNRMRSRVMNGYWVFQCPVGYKYVRVSGRGKMLKRDEPVASIVQEALEGYASGRFETKADVMRFLQSNPLFPKPASGRICAERVSVLLKQHAYAGYVDAPSWDVSLRPGQHEGLISFATFQKIQERLNGINRAPHRKNLNVDFPLRGFVLCDDCGSSLTACWSTGTHQRHPYYLCPKRGCASYGKSIRRDKIEGEFEQLLQQVKPTEKLFRVARMMLVKLWDRKIKHVDAEAKALGAQVLKIDNQVKTYLDRVVEASVPSVIAAYEDRVRKLEEEKLLIKERMANLRRPASSLDDTLRTALDFIANPLNLWGSGRLADRRAVLKLTFVERLRYDRKEGFRTANLSLPFKVLGEFLSGGNGMARPAGIEPAFAT